MPCSRTQYGAAGEARTRNILIEVWDSSARGCDTITSMAPLIDIAMFYIKYLTMHTVQMHTGAIRKLL